MCIIKKKGLKAQLEIISSLTSSTTSLSDYQNERMV